jgi:hypothetical protein
MSAKKMDRSTLYVRGLPIELLDRMTVRAEQLERIAIRL